MGSIIKAVKNQAVKRLLMAIEAQAKAEARSGIMAEIAGRLEKVIKFNDFNPEHFIQDLREGKQADDKAVKVSQGEALTALGMMEIQDQVGQLNVKNPSLIAQAIEIDHIIKTSIDDTGKLNIVIEGQTGLTGDTLQDHLKKMRISPETCFLFEERPTGSLRQHTDAIKNPWKKETFNLTLQGKIVTENPAMAAKFREEARTGR